MAVDISKGSSEADEEMAADDEFMNVAETAGKKGLLHQMKV